MNALSLAMGAMLGAGALYALDRWGSGSAGVVRMPNPKGGPLIPDEVIPAGGRQSRIPTQLEDYLRGAIRAGCRVWVESLGDGYEYVIEEVHGKRKRTRIIDVPS